MIGIIKDLMKIAPNAIFTKGEAVRKANKIINLILEDEGNEDYHELLKNIAITVEDFDDPDPIFNLVIGCDVKFITWDLMDNVIMSRLCDNESITWDIINKVTV